MNVLSVNKSDSHTFSKYAQASIELVEGLGVKGDAHMDTTNQQDTSNTQSPNLRQVHLIHAELFEEVRKLGFEVKPGELGENITTTGIDLLSLPKDTILKIGDQVKLQVTGLRDPCRQINRFRAGLMNAVTLKDESGEIIGKVGIMSMVLSGGTVKPGDTIEIELPAEPHQRLFCV